MSKKGKIAAVLSAAAFVMAAAIAAGPSDAFADTITYSLWIGNVQLTSDNCDNILGELGEDGKPTASYDADTRTLYLNGVDVQSSHYYSDGNDYALFAPGSASRGSSERVALVRNLVITGENSFTGGDGDVFIESVPSSYDVLWITNNPGAPTIQGTGILRCKGRFRFEDGCKYDEHLLYGETVDEEKGIGQGPMIEAKNSIVFKNLCVDMYGGILKGEKKTKYTYYRSIDLYTGYIYMHNDSLLVAKSFGEQAIWVNLAQKELEDDNPGYGFLKGANKNYVGWVAFGRETDADGNPTVLTMGLDEMRLDPTAEDYADTDIDVLGFTEDTVIYSVDVEWGAMTFQWENSTWDATEHKAVAGAGWRVYDSTTEKALDAAEDAINEIKVTNHSNAKVWATLSYKSAEAYDPDTAGAFGFEYGTDAADTDVLTAEDAENGKPAYLSLDTADNGKGEDGAGLPTVGKAYFMPSGLKDELKAVDGIAKWTQLGTITVGIVTDEP